LFFLSDRPTRVIAEKALSPPRGTRSPEIIAAIGEELRAVLAQAAAEAGSG
jgi:NitT/TauT family transport system ATP-binding protein